MKKRKIVVFTGNFSYSVRKGIAEIDQAIPGLTWLVLIHSPPKNIWQLLQNQWRNLKRNGWRWIPYQLGDLWQRVVVHPVRHADHQSPGALFTETALKAYGNIAIRTVADIHSDAAREAVQAFEPALGLSLAAPILQHSLFSIPVLGTMNLHKGKVPGYRGMPPAFWELWNNETSIGCTVHWVDEQLDTGNVVRETAINREKYATVRGMQLRLDEVGVNLMREAVHDVLSEIALPVTQASGGKTYRKPTLTQIAELEVKLLRNQTPVISPIKHLVKTGVASSIFRLSQCGMHRMITPRITVLLYHRVSDAARDNLTVGIAQFDRQMALLRKHCRVLSIEELLALKDNIPRQSAPLICVTFDDGYLDNFTNAAQILLRHEIPAAFFVSTGLIGTDRAFPHDVRRANMPIPMMNWDHLRKMRDYGFTVGSHTVNHIDCAAEPEEIVRGELIQSRDDLRHQLNLDEVLFAYPYGGRSHMTPQRLELVKQAGYAGCLAAYGGVNIGSVNPFNVLRRGIHWEFSDQSFLFSCLGLT